MRVSEYQNFLKNKIINFYQIRDLKRSKLIRESLEVLQEEYNSFIEDDEVIELFDDEIILSDYEYLLPTKFLWSLISDASKINLGNNKITNSRIDLTNNELFEYIYDFFKNSTDKKMFLTFEKLFNKRKKTVFFLDDKENKYDSNSFYLPYTNEAYIRMVTNHKFSDLSTLAHEYGHNIQMSSNYNKKLFTDFGVFSEIVSTFFELLCMDYFTIDNLTKKANFTKYEKLEETVLNSYNLNCEIKLICSLNPNNEKYNARNIIKKLQNTDENLVKNILMEQPIIYYQYNIGMVIATNLFDLYLIDKEKALYMLNKIININENLSLQKYYSILKEMNLTNIDGLIKYNDDLTRRLVK